MRSRLSYERDGDNPQLYSLSYSLFDRYFSHEADFSCTNGCGRNCPVLQLYSDLNTSSPGVKTFHVDR